VERVRFIDPLLSEARARVASGAWGDVRALLASRESEVRLQPELIALLGEAYLRTHAPRDAVSWLDRAELELRRGGDRVALRRATNLAGVARFELGELEDAESAFHGAFTLGRLDGDDLLLARATNNLGTIANIRGDRAKALTLYQLAIPAYQRLGNTKGLAESFHNIAISYRYLGQLARADEYEQQAIHFAREANVPRLLALGRLERAEISFKAGDAELAEAGARRAAQEFSDMGDKLREADALRLVGAAALAARRFATARQALDMAVALSHQLESALNEAEALFVRAQLSAAQQNTHEAGADARAAIAIYERLGASVERATVEEWIARSIVSSTD